jgi:hypothetical protein
VGFGECLEGRAGEIIRLKSHSHSLAFLLYLLLLFEKKKKKQTEILHPHQILTNEMITVKYCHPNNWGILQRNIHIIDT